MLVEPFFYPFEGLGDSFLFGSLDAGVAAWVDEVDGDVVGDGVGVAVDDVEVVGACPCLDYVVAFAVPGLPLLVGDVGSLGEGGC